MISPLHLHSFITINHGVNGTLRRQWTFTQAIIWSPVESITAVQQRSKKTAGKPRSTKCNACVQGWAIALPWVNGVQRNSQNSAAPNSPANSATPELPGHASSLLVQGCERRKAWDSSKKAARCSYIHFQNRACRCPQAEWGCLTDLARKVQNRTRNQCKLKSSCDQEQMLQHHSYGDCNNIFIC